MHNVVGNFPGSSAHLQDRDDFGSSITDHPQIHISWVEFFTFTHSSSNCTWINSSSSIKRSCSFFPCIPLRHNRVRIVISRPPKTSSRAEASTPKANNYIIFSTIPEDVFKRYKTVFLRTVNFFPHA
jgi:hypothetical protein